MPRMSTNTARIAMVVDAIEAEREAPKKPFSSPLHSPLSCRQTTASEGKTKRREKEGEESSWCFRQNLLRRTLICGARFSWTVKIPRRCVPEAERA